MLVIRITVTGYHPKSKVKVKEGSFLITVGRDDQQDASWTSKGCENCREPGGITVCGQPCSNKRIGLET